MANELNTEFHDHNGTAVRPADIVGVVAEPGLGLFEVVASLGDSVLLRVAATQFRGEQATDLVLQERADDRLSRIIREIQVQRRGSRIDPDSQSYQFGIVDGRAGKTLPDAAASDINYVAGWEIGRHMRSREEKGDAHDGD